MKKATKLLSVFFLLQVFLYPFSKAQNLESLVSKTNQYQVAYPFEKVFLHTDKPHYFLNDTIWIKAYGTLQKDDQFIYNTPTVPVYVELIDNQSKKKVSKLILKMEKGIGRGDITLPSGLSAGMYTLRAYSTWMRNFEPEVFFHQAIYIGELGKVSSGAAPLQNDFELMLFPEGGDLVDGISTSIGYKAIGQNGKGIQVRGHIIDSNQDTLGNFSSSHLGIGSFTFIPRKSEKYEVVATAGGNQKRIGFPEIKEKGYVLNVNSSFTADQLEIYIKSNITEKETLHLMALSKGAILFTQTFEGGAAMKKFTLNKADFKSGIIQFSLLDRMGNPLAERLVFLKPEEKSLAKFVSSKTSYGPNETVRMEIQVKDAFGKPVQGNFSLSATDGIQVHYPSHAQNISTYMDLSTELKGEIEQPAFYFDATNPTAAKDLDNLLLTQGWRRFDWSHLDKLEKEREHFFDFGINLAGRVLPEGRRGITEPKFLTLIVNQEDHPLVYDGQTDEKGYFSFQGLDFEDSTSIYIQVFTVNKNRKNNPIQVKPNEVEFFEKNRPDISLKNSDLLTVDGSEYEFKEYWMEVKQADLMMQQFLKNQMVELEEVTVQSSQIQRKSDIRAIQYADNPDFTLIVTPQEWVFQNVFQLIRGRFPGVTVSGDVFSINPPPTVTIRGGAPGGSQNRGALFLLDGMPVQTSMAAVIMVPDIERIDLLRSMSKAMIFGPDGAGGVINIFTKRGNPQADQLSKTPKMDSNATLNKTGFAPVRQFYTPPKYIENVGPRIPDYRSTIYWNPEITTDKNGKAVVEFPLTDGKTQVEIRLEGLSIEGKPVSGTYSLKVQ